MYPREVEMRLKAQAEHLKLEVTTQEKAIALTENRLEALEVLHDARVAYIKQCPNTNMSVMEAQTILDKTDIDIAAFNLSVAHENLHRLKEQLKSIEDPSPLLAVRLVRK